eukprot:TRINITY_DN1581_c0_g1_i4.p2 TRINITY_DN1581_c0_g1~~TRINITY_DN1581_c0_g1_i4.p2  ORF type:complete len:125 (+),score=11.07 TRINITY_DN1581_c0_g1_i4:497-871(+)
MSQDIKGLEAALRFEHQKLFRLGAPPKAESALQAFLSQPYLLKHAVADCLFLKNHSDTIVQDLRKNHGVGIEFAYGRVVMCGNEYPPAETIELQTVPLERGRLSWHYAHEVRSAQFVTVKWKKP